MTLRTGEDTLKNKLNGTYVYRHKHNYIPYSTFTITKVQLHVWAINVGPIQVVHEALNDKLYLHVIQLIVKCFMYNLKMANIDGRNMQLYLSNSKLTIRNIVVFVTIYICTIYNLFLLFDNTTGMTHLKRILSFEEGSSRSHYVEALFQRRLRTCRQTEY